MVGMTSVPLTSAAAFRNLPPLIEALAPRLPESGLVLELASGAGQHAAAFSRRFPALRWQPSDRDPTALASIAAWREEAGQQNLLPPLGIDLAGDAWWRAVAEPPAAAFAANVTHIAPWTVSVGLLGGLGQVLPAGAQLFLYGPFLEAGRETAASNLAFDRSLRQQDPAWGLRAAEDLDRVAVEQGLEPVERVQMPSNNLLLIYRRA